MSRSLQTILRSFAGAAFIIFVIGSYVIAAQTPMTGTWKAELKPEKDDKLRISFSRQSEKGRNNYGTGFEFSELQGLSRQDVTGNSRVSFRLVREAGTIECKGSFADGKGSGTFEFLPSRQFVSAMDSRGFKFTDDELFAAATLNVTTAAADGLRSSGFNNLKTEDLFKAVIFKITPEYMIEMASIGFPNLDMEDLVKARIFKIDAEYARQVRQMGFSDESMEGLVKLRIFKVTPEFLREVQAEGLTNLSVEQATKLRIFKIDAAFIRQARAENVPLDVESLVRKRIGVWNK